LEAEGLGGKGADDAQPPPFDVKALLLTSPSRIKRNCRKKKRKKKKRRRKRSKQSGSSTSEVL
jgi:hypothetical protein